MPRIHFLPSGRTIEVKSGTTLFDAARSAGLPVAASCSAEFTCGKCNLKVVAGSESLSPQSQKERALLQRENRPLTDRISCVTAVRGDCTVTASYW